MLKKVLANLPKRIVSTQLKAFSQGFSADESDYDIDLEIEPRHLYQDHLIPQQDPTANEEVVYFTDSEPF